MHATPHIRPCSHRTKQKISIEVGTEWKISIQLCLGRFPANMKTCQWHMQSNLSLAHTQGRNQVSSQDRCPLKTGGWFMDWPLGCNEKTPRKYAQRHSVLIKYMDTMYSIYIWNFFFFFSLFFILLFLFLLSLIRYSLLCTWQKVWYDFRLSPACYFEAQIFSFFHCQSISHAIDIRHSYFVYPV